VFRYRTTQDLRVPTLGFIFNIVKLGSYGGGAGKRRPVGLRVRRAGEHSSASSTDDGAEKAYNLFLTVGQGGDLLLCTRCMI